MALLCFLPAGNYSRKVSYSTWHYCVSCRQETICEGFPTRHGTTVFLADRKLFAEGFLLDMALLCFIATGNFFAGRFLDSARNDMRDMATLCFLPTGNCLRRVSCSTWQHCVSCRQETVRERFPIRLDATVFLTGRKLFAKGFLFGMTLLCFIAAGNFFAGRFLDSARNDRGHGSNGIFYDGQRSADSG